jgi:hypothetical protein
MPAAEVAELAELASLVVELMAVLAAPVARRASPDRPSPMGALAAAGPWAGLVMAELQAAQAPEQVAGLLEQQQQPQLIREAAGAAAGPMAAAVLAAPALPSSAMWERRKTKGSSVSDEMQSPRAAVDGEIVSRR